jgi:tripartite-type tricarboxylate transporter receptor subunit TctC
MNSSKLAGAMALAALASLAPQTAFAQAFPTKPVRLVVPFPPGGAVDISARLIGGELTKLLPQPVVIENRPGAGGNVAAEMVARSAPDGYTLLMTTSGIHAINPALYAKLPFDAIKDFTPVSVVVSLINVIVVHPSVPVKSVTELIAAAKAAPGKLAYASSGSGTTIHLSAELFRSMAGINMLHVPYKGSAPAVTDLLAGQVNLMFDNIPSALPHVRAGKLRALAVTGNARSPLMSDLPTVSEAGLPGYESSVWFGIVGPAGMAAPALQRLSSDTMRAVANAEFRARLLSQGYDPVGNTPEQMAQMIRDDVPKWGKVVRDSGAKAE